MVSNAQAVHWEPSGEVLVLVVGPSAELQAQAVKEEAENVIGNQHHQQHIRPTRRLFFGALKAI